MNKTTRAAIWGVVLALFITCALFFVVGFFLALSLSPKNRHDHNADLFIDRSLHALGAFAPKGSVYERGARAGEIMMSDNHGGLPFTAPAGGRNTANLYSGIGGHHSQLHHSAGSSFGHAGASHGGLHTSHGNLHKGVVPIPLVPNNPNMEVAPHISGFDSFPVDHLKKVPPGDLNQLGKLPQTNPQFNTTAEVMYVVDLGVYDVLEQAQSIIAYLNRYDFRPSLYQLPGHNPLYSVHAGQFRTKGEAEQVAAKLREAGFPQARTLLISTK